MLRATQLRSKQQKSTNKTQLPHDQMAWNKRFIEYTQRTPDRKLKTEIQPTRKETIKQIDDKEQLEQG